MNYNQAQRKLREEKVKEMLFTLIPRENHKTAAIEHLPYSLKHIAYVNHTTVRKVIGIAIEEQERLKAEKEENEASKI